MLRAAATALALAGLCTLHSLPARPTGAIAPPTRARTPGSQRARASSRTWRGPRIPHAGLPQPGQRLRQQEAARAGQPRFRRSAQALAAGPAGPVRPRGCRSPIWGSTIAPSPTSRSSSSSIRTACAPSTSAASPTSARAISTWRWQISRARSRSIRHSTTPETIGRLCLRGRASSRRRSPTTARLSASSPDTFSPTGTAAEPTSKPASTTRRSPTTRPPAR